ncbi:hypothetical protein WVIC16_110147 [Weissella viridescens]|uniref:DUF600 family protein n=1 Tax=Weissella viridescens TaxID=1629 RepID=A0A0R2H8W3_WEIVI|nr:hypothetical protein [Weissella viridescens]KRN46572.1 hypothetical protein IV50_GL000851 [Weissella viridescens]GEA94417.1 hypothetical protein WVI01_03400 [Weissella viridescens]SOB42484.1 hypothetical protein WVIC16_110147 [Weissella viridescens]SUP52828.1 Uncharacterised protein [Weissella viridescens]
MNEFDEKFNAIQTDIMQTVYDDVMEFDLPIEKAYIFGTIARGVNAFYGDYAYEISGEILKPEQVYTKYDNQIDEKKYDRSHLNLLKSIVGDMVDIGKLFVDNGVECPKEYHWVLNIREESMSANYEYDPKSAGDDLNYSDRDAFDDWISAEQCKLDNE